jgi:hypothetical protein
LRFLKLKKIMVVLMDFAAVLNRPEKKKGNFSSIPIPKPLSGELSPPSPSP